MIIPEDHLAAIRARRAAILDAPWRMASDTTGAVVLDLSGEPVCFPCAGNEAEAVFIAKAPGDITTLLALVAYLICEHTDLSERLAAWQDHLSRIHGIFCDYPFEVDLPEEYVEADPPRPAALLWDNGFWTGNWQAFNQLTPLPRTPLRNGDTLRYTTVLREGEPEELCDFRVVRADEEEQRPVRQELPEMKRLIGSVPGGLIDQPLGDRLEEDGDE